MDEEQPREHLGLLTEGEATELRTMVADVTHQRRVLEALELALTTKAHEILANRPELDPNTCEVDLDRGVIMRALPHPVPG